VDADEEVDVEGGGWKIVEELESSILSVRHERAEYYTMN